jgi:Zn-dependent metalloprotease
MKIKIRFFLLIAGILSFLFGRVVPDSTQLSAYHHLNKKYNNSINVHWNKSNGLPDIITFYNPVSYKKNKEESVRIFFKEISDLLKIRTTKDSLLLVSHDKHKGREYFRYQQTYENIPVRGGDYVVTVQKDGSIRTALGFFYKDININVNPGITHDDALQIALENPPGKRELEESGFSHELIIYPVDGNFSLVYELHISDHCCPK